jgi:hypothetical protein
VRASTYRVLAVLLGAGLLAWPSEAAAAQERLDLAIAAGPSPYDLSGTGTGTAGAAFLAWSPMRGLVVEPGVTVFSYRSQFDERTSLLFPELSIQGELPIGRFRPFLGGGGGGAFRLAGTGETAATLHAVGGTRVDIGNAWTLLGEMRIRAVHPFTGNTVDFLFGIGRRLR